MSLDTLDEDPHDPEPPLRKRLAHKLLGDPRKAPSRLLYLLLFVLIALIVVGVWSAVRTESSSSSSSYWVVRLLASVFNTMWVLVPVAIYAYWRYIGVLRHRHAAAAADVTGWLAETITHLSDEMRSTDGTTRVISTTDHSYEEITANVDAALRGDSHGSEEVDYYGRHRHSPDPEADGETAANQPALERPASVETTLDAADAEAGGDPASELDQRKADLIAREEALVEEYERLRDEIDECLDSALDADADFDADDPNLDELDDHVSLFDLLDESGQANVETAEDLLDELEAVEAELDEIWDELVALDDHDPDVATAPEQAPADDWADADTRPADGDENRPDDIGGAVADEIGGGLVPVEDADRPETVREAWGAQSGIRASVRAVAGHLGRRSVDGGLTLLSLLVTAAVGGYTATKTRMQRWLSVDPADIDDEEWEIPWKVRFAEELKHLFLDLSASLHGDDVLWKFGLPTGVTFVMLMLVAKLWVNPLLYLVFAAVAVLVGLFVFWFSKKRRSRRLRMHRQTEEWSYWDDAAGRVKTVETRDVTAYMGWLSGRRYASYNREEFVREFSLRLHQRTHDERVAPSVLEQYARNLAQMKPNLRGHLEHIERPQIQQELKHAVKTNQNQVIDKATLAMEVIEHPGEDKRIASDLGHDPRLVGDEYRWLVEEGHVLSEVKADGFKDASGQTTTKTLVYPADKTRLPDMEALHSQFSDRFTGAHGDPYYSLPECNPTDDLRGFVPSPTVARKFRAAEESGA